MFYSCTVSLVIWKGSSTAYRPYRALNQCIYLHWVSLRLLPTEFIGSSSYVVLDQTIFFCIEPRYHKNCSEIEDRVRQFCRNIVKENVKQIKGCENRSYRGNSCVTFPYWRGEGLAAGVFPHSIIIYFLSIITKRQCISPARKRKRKYGKNCECTCIPPIQLLFIGSVSQ